MPESCSGSPAPAGQEKEIAKVVAAEMKAAGFERVKVDGLFNVIGVIKGESPRFRLMLNGHLDHAEAGSMKNPYSGKIMEREGRKVIWGRGACDMKGAVAAMVFAGKAVKDSGVKLKSSAILTAVSLEEAGRGEGIKRLLGKEKIRADMAISGEATNLQINLGHRGKLEFDVLAKGKTTHGSTPSLGINAIFQMKKFIEKLETAYRFAGRSFLRPVHGHGHRHLGQPRKTHAHRPGSLQPGRGPEISAVGVGGIGEKGAGGFDRDR